MTLKERAEKMAVEFVAGEPELFYLLDRLIASILSQLEEVREEAEMETRLERDKLWSEALVYALSPVEIHEVTAYFNERRPDRKNEEK